MSRLPWDDLKPQLEDILDKRNCYLYDYQWIKAKSSYILRIYIDKKDEASLEDCEFVSREFGQCLDEQEPLVSSYSLEVSTPGIERSLRLPWHFEKSIGKTICVKTKEGFESPKSKRKIKTLTGELKEIKDNHLTIEAKNHLWVIPQEKISKSHIVFFQDKK